MKFPNFHCDHWPGHIERSKSLLWIFIYWAWNNVQICWCKNIRFDFARMVRIRKQTQVLAMNAHAQQHCIAQNERSNRCSFCINSAAYIGTRDQTCEFCAFCVCCSLTFCLSLSFFHTLVHSISIGMDHENKIYENVPLEFYIFSRKLKMMLMIFGRIVCMCRLLIVASVYSLLAFHLCDALLLLLCLLLRVFCCCLRVHHIVHHYSGFLSFYIKTDPIFKLCDRFFTYLFTLATNFALNCLLMLSMCVGCSNACLFSVEFL